MIVPMKKLTLAALLEHREAILQALQSICAVQLISIGEGEQSSAAAEGRVQRLQSAEELLKPYAGKAGFGPKPEATRQELEEDIQPALEICAELEGLQRRIAQNGSDTEKRRLQLGSLLPWADMTDPLEKVHSTASIKVMTGTVPAEGVKALMETGALVQLYGGDKERAALVICPNEEYAGIAPSIRATGFQEKGFGDIRGTASENIQRLRTEIEALEAERAQLEARLAAFGTQAGGNTQGAGRRGHRPGQGAEQGSAGSYQYRVSAHRLGPGGHDGKGAPGDRKDHGRLLSRL